MKSSVTVTLLLIITLMLFGCHSGNHAESSNESDFQQSSPSVSSESSQPIVSEITSGEQPASQNTVITWEEISSDGVNEELLTRNIDTAVLEKIASKFQTLCENIAAKEDADPDYVLRGGWIEDIPISQQYLSVIDMGSRAMKPLYMIIYKSDNQGLYEYICCLALEELSGYDLENKAGDKWATSKEFLTMFNEKLLN